MLARLSACTPLTSLGGWAGLLSVGPSKFDENRSGVVCCRAQCLETQRLTRFISHNVLGASFGFVPIDNPQRFWLISRSTSILYGYNWMCCVDSGLAAPRPRGFSLPLLLLLLPLVLLQLRRRLPLPRWLAVVASCSLQGYPSQCQYLCPAPLLRWCWLRSATGL